MKDYKLSKTEELTGAQEVDGQVLNLSKLAEDFSGKKLKGIFKSFRPFLAPEKRVLIISSILILINSTGNVLAPFVLGIGVDRFVTNRDYNEVITYTILLAIIYVIVLITGYYQSMMMGSMGQRVLFRLRNRIFQKIQEMPTAFFNQNKSGDLISRINSDTDKLNQLFSEILIRLIGSIFTIIGIGIFILFINWKLALVTLTAAFLLLVYTQFVSPWIEKRNKMSLTSLGGLSAEIQESLNNFKVILAFNRRDYFRDRFNSINDENYKMAVRAGIANNMNTPVYDFAANLAQISVLLFGIYLITQGQLTLGILISFITYANQFYAPLRQLASLFASVQLSFAAWGRVDEILKLETDLTVSENSSTNKNSKYYIDFQEVSFGYDEKNTVLESINFDLEKGKKYAFVGPTGGGKTTTASLIMRLFDPSTGKILLEGKDLRSYSPAQMAQKIGFILQEPFLFTGTLAENIIYGNEKYKNFDSNQVLELLKEKDLAEILERFPDGITSQVDNNSENLSLGQKQLIAFLRAILREPELLILDEATANIDTVTEKQLQKILDRLPENTTLITIAHRLNTIQDADEILFVNGKHVEKAGNYQQAINLIEQSKRSS